MKLFIFAPFGIGIVLAAIYLSVCPFISGIAQKVTGGQIADQERVLNFEVILNILDIILFIWIVWSVVG